MLREKAKSAEEFDNLNVVQIKMFTKRPETEEDETTETDDVRTQWLACIQEVCKGIFNKLDPRETGFQHNFMFFEGLLLIISFIIH